MLIRKLILRGSIFSLLYFISLISQAQTNTFPASGNVGIGTTTPSAGVDIEKMPSSGNGPSLVVSDSSGVANLGTLPVAQVYQGQSATNDALDIAVGQSNYTGTFGYWYTNTAASSAFTFLRMTAGPTNVFWINGNGDLFAHGNTGIGINAPSDSRLEVNGSVKLTAGSGASVTFADSTVQSTAWNGTTFGGDYAESVDVTGPRNTYEPGDVLVLDKSRPGHFLKADQPFSRLVAGVYSTKPGLTGHRHATSSTTSSAEVPMAMMGIVPTKVTTENGPIEIGDLLVSSSVAGHAMNAGGGAIPTGTVIGKAMESLRSGNGVIEVLISLQ